jgi:hypothetical protein
VGLVLTGVVVVLAAGLIATGIAMAIHGQIKHDTLTDFRDHSGLVSGVAGTLFAITVGMLVVASWGAIGTAKDNAAAEARSLDDLAWFAHTMRQPYENRLTALLQTYTSQVINDDWPLMAKTETVSPQAWNTLDAIRYEFNTYTPQTGAESTRYQQALGQLQTVYDDRLTRQDEARSTVPSILWLSLVVSGSVVVIVPMVFGSTRRMVHALLSFATAGVMAFVLFMIAEFTHPFSGAIKADSAAFVTTEEHIRQIDTLWANAGIQESRAVYKPAPVPHALMSLLATSSPSEQRAHKEEHHHRVVNNEVPVPGLPAPGVPAPVVQPAGPTSVPPAPPPPTQEPSTAPPSPQPPPQQGSPSPQSS